MSSTAAPKLSPERIFTTLTAYQQTYALRAAIELDLFTAIGEGANEPALLAKRLKAAERGVRILADYLTVHGFLRKENGEYLLTQESAVFLDRRSPAAALPRQIPSPFWLRAGLMTTPGSAGSRSFICV